MKQSAYNVFSWRVGAIASALVLALNLGCREGREEAGGGNRPAEPEAGPGRNPPGEEVVRLDAGTQARAGLVIAPAAAATLRPEVTAYGKVLDPAPLIALHGDLLLAETALTHSEAQRQRTRTLFAEDQNASRRALDAAEAEFRADEIRVQAARSRLSLEWGESIAGMGAGGRADLIAQLLDRKTALLRVDLPLGEVKLAERPGTARVAMAGSDEKFFEASVLGAAPAANQRVPGEGYLLRVDGQGASLRPGVPVSARLPLPGEPQAGAIVPRAALIRHLGQAWGYVQVDADTFERRPVALANPADSGWFVKEGIRPGDKLVVEGGQALLSEQLKAQIHLGE